MAFTRDIPKRPGCNKEKIRRPGEALWNDKRGRRAKVVVRWTFKIEKGARVRVRVPMSDGSVRIGENERIETPADLGERKFIFSVYDRVAAAAIDVNNERHLVTPGDVFFFVRRKKRARKL